MLWLIVGAWQALIYLGSRQQVAAMAQSLQTQSSQQQQLHLQWLDEFLVDASSVSGSSNQQRETRNRQTRHIVTKSALLSVPDAQAIGVRVKSLNAKQSGHTVHSQSTESPEADALCNDIVDESESESEIESEQNDRSEFESERGSEEIDNDCPNDVGGGECESLIAIGSTVREQELEQLVQQSTHRCEELQSDIDVLAAHLEMVMKEREAERAEMTRERDSFRIEVEALRRENEELTKQHATSTQKLATAMETHEQLLSALTEEQQKNEQLQASNHIVSRDRATAKRMLDTAQLACRRLEEELANAHSQLLQLQDDRKSLEAALKSAAHRKADSETTQLQLQDEMIHSLRADLLQMEFEYKTLQVDNQVLEGKVGKLERRRSAAHGKSGSASSAASVSSTSLTTEGHAGSEYDVISLASAAEAAPQGKKRTTIRPLKARDSARGSMFGSLMDLPNYVGERQESAVAPVAKQAKLHPHHDQYHVGADSREHEHKEGERHGRHGHGHGHGPGIVSLMAKTVKSAKKRFGPGEH